MLNEIEAGQPCRTQQITFNLIESRPTWEDIPMWRVDFYDVWAVWPLGWALVYVPAEREYLGATSPRLAYVFVHGQCRREGIATRLIQACLERWPDLRISDGVSRSGRALHRRISELGWLPEPE